MPCKRSPPVDILHQASDWLLIADFNSNYCYPVHIAFTQLTPAITIFSNNLRKAILIKLTCSCEENMESWHSTKINKYLALKTVIESNGWCVELFAVEVGARGYCSRSVFCYFKKMGFSNTLIRNTIKDWTPTANCHLNDRLKETATHHLLCHLLNRPSIQCQMQS